MSGRAVDFHAVFVDLQPAAAAKAILNSARDNPVEAFVAEVRRIASAGEVSAVEDTEFGRKYTVPGELRGPSGSLQVVTVWIQEPGREDVRLVTVRPR